ncbi:MAG: permease, partial [Methylocystaceae bacterium]
MISLFDVMAAFGGGVLASAIGALPAFIFAGLLVVANLTDLAFGPLFGPHIAFAGAVAATAFAAKRGLESGKDILAPLIKMNDGTVLLVGGIFGAFGMIVQKYLASIKTPTDTVALTVVITCVAARLIFGNRRLFSKYIVPDGKTSWTLIMFGLGVGLISGYVAIVTKNPVLAFGVAAVLLLV